MDQYLQMQQKSQEELEKELRPEAEKRVQLALILSEVAKEEKLTVGQDEIENEIAGLRAQYTDPVMQKELAGDQIREDVYNHLMSTKVINKLTQYAQSK
jgi:trigger factor